MSEKILALFRILNDKINWYSQKLSQKGRGRKWKFKLKSIIYCSILFVLKQFTSSYQLINFLQDKNNQEAEDFRRLGGFDQTGIPDRRTFERRCFSLTSYLRAIIQQIGQALIKLGIVDKKGRVIDATTTLAYGNVWHKKLKQQNIIPSCGNIDRQAEWGRDSQGFKYGYKAHILGSISPICVPLDILITTANVADDTQLEELSQTLTKENKHLLADGKYDVLSLYEATKAKGCRLMAGINKRTGQIASKARQKIVKFMQTKQAKILYQQRSKSIEPTNRHFKNLFSCLKKAIVKGLNKISLYWMSSTIIYQLAIIYNYLMKRPLKHIKSIIY